MTKVIKMNHFSNCKSFADITHEALRLANKINSDGIVKVNLHISRKELSAYFHSFSGLSPIHYLHGGAISHHTLEDLSEAFDLHLAKSRKEASYA